METDYRNCKRIFNYNMKIAIIEDEPNEQKLIIKYLSEWADSRKEPTEFSAFPNSESFLFTWEEDKTYGLLVLDIEMGEMNGMELAYRVRAEDSEIPILFVTGYDEYIQAGYDVSALHYLLKPVSKDKLFQVLDNLKRSQPKDLKSLLVTSEDKMRRIPINDILYAEAAGHGSVLHTTHEVIPIRESFGEIEKQAAQTDEMIKCHRAYQVNLRFISAIQNTTIILDNGEMLPVSRSQMKRVQQAFLRFYRKG